MPPKPKYTKEQIVLIALDVVSQKGVDALTAKELGAALGTSTSPIFTVFRSMQEVQEAVRAVAMERFEAFGANTLPDAPLFKQIGMKMVLFALQEPKLYQLLFMQENQQAVSFSDIFGLLGPTAEVCMEAIRQEYGLGPDAAKMLFENMWIYTFGVGVLCATKVCRFSEEELSRMLSTQFRAMLWLVRQEPPTA